MVKIIYIVVSEGYYGGWDLVNVFDNQEDAQKYAEDISEKRNLDMVVLTRTLDAAVKNE